MKELVCAPDRLLQVGIFCVCAMFLTADSRAEDRTWTSEDGKKIVGEMLRETEAGDGVVLKVGEKEFTVPLDRLSEEDRAWVADRKKEAEERAKEFAALAGTTKTFSEGEGIPAAFHVYYPSSYSAEKASPMIILFSPGGHGEGILRDFRESCENLGWIGVGCDTFRNDSKSEEMDPLFGELLPVIEQSVVHDPQRLYMGGMSGGAARAIQYTAKFDREWKGVVSCGGWLGKEFDLDYRKGMAVAWVNGDTDEGANSWVVQDSGVLEGRRCKTKLFAFPGGHVVGPPEVLTEAMEWVEENTKK